MARIFSKSAQVGQVIIIDPNVNYNHTFVSVKYFSDAALQNPVTPSAGNIQYEGKANGAGGWADFTGSPIDCTDTGIIVSTNVPLEQIKATPSGIVGAAYYQVTVTSKDK